MRDDKSVIQGYMSDVCYYRHQHRDNNPHLGDRQVPLVRKVNFVMRGMAMFRTASQSMLKSRKSHFLTPCSLSAVRIVRPSEEVSAIALGVGDGVADQM